MADFLPGIDIAVSINPPTFLQRMADIGRKTEQFTVEYVSNGIAGRDMDVVNFRFLGESPHEECGFQLIARKDSSKRVFVEVRARRWSPEPPTKDIYTEAARDMAGGLLKKYNKAHASRYRLRVGSRNHNRYKMTERTTKLLDRFVVLANTTSLHPLDWKRFYALVHEGRQEIPMTELASKLRAAGFSPERADSLIEIYNHLWAFKRMK